MLRLIVNGDDFGVSELVNKAILNSYQNGILRSTSLLANGNSFDDAVKKIKSNPELDIGAHLSLVKGKPVLDAAKINSLLIHQDSFCENALDFGKRYYSNKISFDEVEKELTAQIEKLLDHNIKLSHIDSHQHLHILPKVFEIVIKLSNKYKIKFIRVPREHYSGYMFFNLRLINSLVQMSVINFFCLKAKRKVFITTDYFAGSYFGGRLTKKHLLTIVNNLPQHGVCELICHPGFEDLSSNLRKSNYRKMEEMHSLTDEDVMEILSRKKIILSSFRSISM